MTRRIVIPLILALFSVLFAGPAHATAGPRYFTASTGRGQCAEGTGTGNGFADGAFSTLQVAKYMKGTLGWATGPTLNLIPKYLNAGRDWKSHRWAQGRQVYCSTEDALWLQNSFGSRHSTSGKTYTELDTLSDADAREEVCGAANALTSDGFFGFFGVFAGANPDGPSMTPEQVRDIVRPCGFALARNYGTADLFPYTPKRDNGSQIETNDLDNMSPDHWLRVNSINGGDCPDWATTCTSAGKARHYALPGSFINDMADAPSHSWYNLQDYRLVYGKTDRWDCREGVDHWTYTAETYCWIDYKKILDWVDHSNYIVADAGTVARKEGLS